MSESSSALERAALAEQEWSNLVVPDWYRATYNLAVGLSNEAERNLEQGADAALEAYVLCLELIHDILLLREGRRLSCIPPEVPLPPSLRGDVFLEDLRQASVLLFAGVTRQIGLAQRLPFPTAWSRAESTEDPDRFDEALWTIVRKLLGNDDPTDEAEHSLASFFVAVRLVTADGFEVIFEIPSVPEQYLPLDDWLISWLTHDADAHGRTLTSSVSYNLACLFSLKGDTDKAFAALANAVGGKPALVESARHDTTLEALERADKVRWEKLVPPPKTDEKPSEKGVADLVEEHARVRASLEKIAEELAASNERPEGVGDET